MQTSKLGLGQSFCVGIGAGPFHGTNFIDVLRELSQDPQTQAVVVIGEQDGSHEIETAQWLAKNPIEKPILFHFYPSGHKGTCFFPPLQPTLEGTSVILRPLRPDDWEETYKAGADPLIWAGHPNPDRYTEPAFRIYFDSGIASKGAFAIIDKSSGKIIGSSRYYGFDPIKSEVEIGWSFLVREKWGGATNLQVKLLMLQHAFEFVDTVVFWVDQTNVRSQKALEKIGAVKRKGAYSRTVTSKTKDFIFQISKNKFLPNETIAPKPDNLSLWKKIGAIHAPSPLHFGTQLNKLFTM
jgi:RimJ/RimL family protein N-acetyltransferase